MFVMAPNASWGTRIGGAINLRRVGGGQVSARPQEESQPKIELKKSRKNKERWM